jgi:hypothetical protein
MGSERTAGDRHQLERQHDEDQVHGERGHRQHETAQFQDRRRGQPGDQHRQHGADEQRDQRIDAVLHAQDRARIAADHQEAGLSERELVRVAEQEHETDRAGRHRARDDADAERIAARPDQRIDDHREREGHQGERALVAIHGSCDAPESARRPNRNTPPRNNR